MPLNDSTSDVPSKQCRTCKQVKPLTDFHKAKSQQDERRNQCKDCSYARLLKWRLANPDKMREISRRSHAKHREERSELRRKQYAEHPEKAREASRKQRQENPEKAQEYIRKWKEAHPERVRELAREWYAAHIDEQRLAKRLQRRKRRSVEGSHTQQDIEQQYKRQNRRCYWCKIVLKGEYEVDHIIPLSRGGANDPSNLVIACRSCNRSRGNKLPHEWGKGGHLL